MQGLRVIVREISLHLPRVGRTVETPRQVGGHDLEVLRSGLDQVDDRNLRVLSRSLC
jgi:hypothetical protein